LRLSNKYVDRLQSAAESDIIVAEQLAKVVGLVDKPARLLHPKMLLRVATAGRPAREGRQASTTSRSARSLVE
jgi:hypothetical protein